MAGLALGNLLGAVSQVTTALSKERSLKQFLDTINGFSLQVKNNFEVNFSGIQDATFFVQSIDLPSTKQNFTTLYYDGQVVDVPINFDWDHNFQMTVLNDAQGYIYTAMTNFLAGQVSTRLVNSGYTLTIKALTGDKKYKGALITFKGVRIDSVGGLSWSYDGNTYQTFTVSGRLVEFSYTPGALAKAAGFLGAASSILGRG